MVVSARLRCIRRFRVTTDSRKTSFTEPGVEQLPCPRTQRLLVKRHHLHPDTRRLALPGGYSGGVLARDRRLGDERALGAKLAMDALEMALRHRGRGPAILHSDQGSTYATSDYRDVLSRHQIRQSMSQRGNCWDNGPMESFRKAPH
jgi:transposase InsO family protein